MTDRFSRTEMLLGSDAMDKLRNARVAVFGLGGVGGYIVEALARSGVGALDIIDNDTVSITNLNRQIVAVEGTVGMPKTEAAKMRIMQINPDCKVTAYNTFYMPENSSDFDFTKYDYIADAIDTVTAKIELVMNANKCGTPIICSMGTGNKLNPAELEVADIYKTSVCPLARIMRYELKRRDIKKLKVVYSKEMPIVPTGAAAEKCRAESTGKKNVPGSTAFVPAVAGMIIASEIVKDICSVG